MVRRLHAGNWQALPALCLGKDATFETNSISDATAYGNRLVVYCYFQHRIDLQRRSYLSAWPPLQGGQRSRLTTEQPLRCLGYRDSLMRWRPPQWVFVIMTALTWALCLNMLSSLERHPAVAPAQCHAKVWNGPTNPWACGQRDYLPRLGVRSQCLYEGAVPAGSDNDGFEGRMLFEQQQSPSRSGGWSKMVVHTHDFHTGDYCMKPIVCVDCFKEVLVLSFS